MTVNTLIKDNELSEVSALVRKLDELQADALIIQDIGLLRMLRGALPHMALHASTQMSIHNAAGARWLLSKGVSRVVLARECGMNDIRAVAETGSRQRCLSTAPSAYPSAGSVCCPHR